MKKSTRNILVFGSILLLGIIIYVAIEQGLSIKLDSSGQYDAGQYDEFAQCLTEKGIKLYGTEWCSYCKQQKDAFGSSFKYVDFVDCDKDKQECVSAGVQGYPTWKINEENYPGLHSLDKLAQLSEC